METPSRSETTDIIRQIAEKPFSFDFYRAVRLLEACNAGKPPLGESLSPRDDLVRFRQKPSLMFAPSTVSGVYTASTPKLSGRSRRKQSAW